MGKDHKLEIVVTDKGGNSSTSTQADRNSGRPDVWSGQTGRGDTEDYNLQPAVGGSNRRESDVAPFAAPNFTPPINTWEVLDRWRGGKDDPNLPQGITEEEAHALDEKRDASQGHFGRGDVSDDGFYFDWRAAKHKQKFPDQDPSKVTSAVQGDVEERVGERAKESRFVSSTMSDSKLESEKPGSKSGPQPYTEDDYDEKDFDEEGDPKGSSVLVNAAKEAADKIWDKTKDWGGKAAGGVLDGGATALSGTSATITSGLSGGGLEGGLQTAGEGIMTPVNAFSALTEEIPYVGSLIGGFGEALEGSISVLSDWITAISNASEEVMAFNPKILSERIATDIGVLEAQIERASVAGDELAEFEAARGDFILLLEDIKTVLVKVLAPVATKLLKMLSKWLEQIMGRLPELFLTVGTQIAVFGDRLVTIAAGMFTGWLEPLGRLMVRIGQSIFNMAEDVANAIDALNNAGRHGLNFEEWLGGGGMLQHANNLGIPVRIN